MVVSSSKDKMGTMANKYIASKGELSPVRLKIRCDHMNILISFFKECCICKNSRKSKYLNRRPSVGGGDFLDIEQKAKIGVRLISGTI